MNCYKLLVFNLMAINWPIIRCGLKETFFLISFCSSAVVINHFINIKCCCIRIYYVSFLHLFGTTQATTVIISVTSISSCNIIQQWNYPLTMWLSKYCARTELRQKPEVVVVKIAIKYHKLKCKTFKKAFIKW